ETRLLQMLDEAGPRRSRKRRAESRFGPLPHHLERRPTVELPGDELLKLPEAKKLAGDGVFDNEGRPAGRLLLADGQIPAQSRQSRNHGAASTLLSAAVGEDRGPVR